MWWKSSAYLDLLYPQELHSSTGKTSLIILKYLFFCYSLPQDLHSGFHFLVPLGVYPLEWKYSEVSGYSSPQDLQVLVSICYLNWW